MRSYIVAALFLSFALSPPLKCFRRERIRIDRLEKGTQRSVKETERECGAEEEASTVCDASQGVITAEPTFSLSPIRAPQPHDASSSGIEGKHTTTVLHNEIERETEERERKRANPVREKIAHVFSLFLHTHSHTHTQTRFLLLSSSCHTACPYHAQCSPADRPSFLFFSPFPPKKGTYPLSPTTVLLLSPACPPLTVC